MRIRRCELDAEKRMLRAESRASKRSSRNFGAPSVERYERIDTVRARPAALIYRRSVRAFGARRLGAGLRISAQAAITGAV